MTATKDNANKKKAAEMARVNIIIPKSFHKEIKQRALDEDITVTDLICQAVKEYLKK